MIGFAVVLAQVGEHRVSTEGLNSQAPGGKRAIEKWECGERSYLRVTAVSHNL
jgi:hypothetical protein